MVSMWMLLAVCVCVQSAGHVPGAALSDLQELSLMEKKRAKCRVQPIGARWSYCLVLADVPDG